MSETFKFLINDTLFLSMCMDVRNIEVAAANLRALIWQKKFKNKGIV